MNGFYYQVSKHYSVLSYSEKKIVDYIMDNHKDVIHMAIAKLAEKTGISTATIISTARKLNYSGYSEMKIALAAETNAVSSDHVGFQNMLENTPENLFQIVINTNIKLLQKAASYFDYSKMETAARWIKDANLVYIFGEGTSNIFAHECHSLLIRAGIRCHYEQDWQAKQVLAEQSSSSDVAILISETGVNPRIIDLANIFQAAEVKRIGISNYQKSVLAKNVSILLAPFPDLLTEHNNNFTLLLPIFSVLECLFYTLASSSPRDEKLLFDINNRRSKSWLLVERLENN